ncbi:MAG: phage terminase small subunit P27 family [Bacillota bacterium]
MAVPGRKPKPPKLKLLEGNPGKRKINKDEPRPRPIAPTCPPWLEKEAKKEWRRISRELEHVGLLTIVDMAALAGYCQAYARWKSAEKVISEQGLTMEIETQAGGLYTQQRPEVAIALKYLQQVKAFCAEFGLTPSSRGRMSLPGQEEDDFEGLLD